MARSTKSAPAPVVTSSNNFVAGKRMDICVPLGFVIQVDGDLTMRDGERPTKQRLEHASSTMMARHESGILAALEVYFGKRVSFIEVADCYTGDPASGVAKKVHTETPIPGAPAATIPATPAPIVGTALVDYAELTVPELRGLAKDAGLKTAGSKADLVKRLSNHDKRQVA